MGLHSTAVGDHAGIAGDARFGASHGSIPGFINHSLEPPSGPFTTVLGTSSYLGSTPCLADGRGSIPRELSLVKAEWRSGSALGS